MKFIQSSQDRLRFMMFLMVILGIIGLLISVQPIIKDGMNRNAKGADFFMNRADTHLIHHPGSTRQQLYPKVTDTALFSVPNLP